MTFNVWTFLFQVINFVVLAYVLHRLLYRPLREAIDRRREANERERTEADQARQEAAALREQMQAQLAGLERQRQEAVQQARQQAEAERQTLLKEAEKTAQARREELQQAMDRDREEAMRAFRAEAAGLAMDLARRLVSEACERSLHDHLALRLVEELKQLPDEERSSLRDQWQAGDAAVLETAAELDNGLGQKFTDTLAGILGSPVPLAVRVRPELLSGVRLRLGGHLWDASLAGPLDEARQSLTEKGQ